MRRNDRCVLIRYETKKDYLEDEEIGNEITKIVPCRKTGMSLDEQVGFFGAYRKGSFKLHLQGNVKDIEDVAYPVFENIEKSPKVSIQAIKHLRHSTVVIVG